MSISKVNLFQLRNFSYCITFIIVLTNGFPKFIHDMPTYYTSLSSVEIFSLLMSADDDISLMIWNDLLLYHYFEYNTHSWYKRVNEIIVRQKFHCWWASPRNNYFRNTILYEIYFHIWDNLQMRNDYIIFNIVFSLQK